MLHFGNTKRALAFVGLLSLFLIILLMVLTTKQLQKPTTYKGKAAESSMQGSALFTTYNIHLGENLTLSLPTDLPNGTNDIKFFVMKKNSPTTRSEKFGVSGAHGEWDLLPSLVQISNQRWGSNKTGEEMLEKHYAMLSALGISWIRIDQSWQREEPQKGVFDFRYVDKMFDVAKKYNLKVMMSLSYTPSWSYDQCPGKLPGYPWFTSPIDLVATGSAYYNRFATKMVERYKPHGTKDPGSDYGITHWQIWNEPDIGFWTDCQTGQAGNLQTYSYLLKSAYGTIKNVDPGAKVLMGGLSHINVVNNLEKLYTYLGQDKNLDILDMHSYEDSETLAQKIRDFADVRDVKGDSSKEIWLSETSTYNSPSNPEDPRQSDYMKSMFEKFESLSSSKNLGKAFWWGSREYWFPPEVQGSPDTALFDNNFYPRKVYFDFGEWLGTINKKGEIPASVSNSKINVQIPGDLFNEIGDYIVFYASVSKMVTALPITVTVTEPPPITATPTPPVSTPPSPTVTPTSSYIIQGRRVLMPNNQRVEPACSVRMSINPQAGSTNYNDTPGQCSYSLANLGLTTNYTVTPQIIAGYSVGYTLCYNDINCHGASPTLGSSVSIDVNRVLNENYLPCVSPGNPPGCDPYRYADLWWHYTSNSPTITPTPIPTTTPTPTRQIVLNSGTNTSCNQICQAIGKSCTSIGTNPNATDSKMYYNAFLQFCRTSSANCGTTMNRRGACLGIRAKWTRCGCQ